MQGPAWEGRAFSSSLHPNSEARSQNTETPELDILNHQRTTPSVTRQSAGVWCSDKSRNIRKNQLLSREKLWAIKVTFLHTHGRGPCGTEGPQALEESRGFPYEVMGTKGRKT